MHLTPWDLCQLLPTLGLGSLETELRRPKGDALGGHRVRLGNLVGFVWGGLPRVFQVRTYLQDVE